MYSISLSFELLWVSVSSAMICSLRRRLNVHNVSRAESGIELVLNKRKLLWVTSLSLSLIMNQKFELSCSGKSSIVKEVLVLPLIGSSVYLENSFLTVASVFLSVEPGWLGKISVVSHTWLYTTITIKNMPPRFHSWRFRFSEPRTRFGVTSCKSFPREWINECDVFTVKS